MITTTVMVSDVRILTADHPSLTVPPRVWPQSWWQCSNGRPPGTSWRWTGSQWGECLQEVTRPRGEEGDGRVANVREKKERQERQQRREVHQGSFFKVKHDFVDHTAAVTHTSHHNSESMCHWTVAFQFMKTICVALSTTDVSLRFCFQSCRIRNVLLRLTTI